MCLGVANHIQWMMECLNHSAFFGSMLASLIPPPLHIHSTLPMASWHSIKECDWSDLYRGSAIVTWDTAVMMLMKCAESNIHSWNKLPPNVERELLKYIRDAD